MARLAARAPLHVTTLNTLTLFAGCVAIWGTTWLAITYQLGNVAPEASVSYRFLLAAALVAAYCRLRALPMCLYRSPADLPSFCWRCRHTVLHDLLREREYRSG